MEAKFIQLLMIISMYILATIVKPCDEININATQIETIISTSIAEPTEPTETRQLEIVETTEATEATEATEQTIEVEVEPIEAEIWWTSDELDMLAAAIYYEAGSNECTDRHQQLVGQVIINRMNNSKFPDTIYDVITQYGQYSTCNMILRDMGTGIIPQRCYDNALIVLNGGVDCPDDIVWQANFKQGSGVYEEIYTSYSVSYFCYQ